MRGHRRDGGRVRRKPERGGTSPRTIGVAGLGYMGLATALGFAHHGVPVLGYDRQADLRRALAHGKTSIHEPGLPALLQQEVRDGRFRVVDSWDDLVGRAQIIFLCLPTPEGRHGRIDLGPLIEGTRQLGRALRAVSDRRLVVVKSTVVAGTTERVLRPLLERSAGKSAAGLAVAVNPEFLAEGRMLQDVLRPERIVLGVSHPRDALELRRLYRPFRAPVRTLTPTGAELVKYAANAFLATKVTLANEFARLAERVGVDVDPVLEAVGRDSRIGGKFLWAGPGFGGSCFEKDVRAVIAKGRGLGLRLPTLEAVVRSNAEQAAHAYSLVRDWMGGARGRRIAVLGLSFKPGTDDVRGSRAVPIAQSALAEGASVRVHDPVALAKFRREWTRASGRSTRAIRFCRTPEEALDGADAAVVHTPWPEYDSFPPEWTGRMRSPLVVDLRRALPLDVRHRSDLLWIGLGAPPPVSSSSPHVPRVPSPGGVRP
jgi:UDPglucose 6-dehydrogenase